MKALIVLVAVAAAAQAFPHRENDIASAAAAGDWDEVHRILSNRISARYNFKPLSADVKIVRPQYTSQYPQQNLQQQQYQETQQQSSNPPVQATKRRVFDDDYLEKLIYALATQNVKKDGVASASAVTSVKYAPF